MKEYIISAEDVKVLEEAFNINLSFEKDEELIRCEDCKLNPKRMWVGCPMAHCLDRTDDWYCPVGKRKETE